MKIFIAFTIWQPSLKAATPDTLMGRPVYISAFMPAVAAGVSDESNFADDLENAKAVVLYMVAYPYEHREEADHRG